MNDSETSARPTVVLYNRYSLLADALARVLSTAGLEIIGRATAPEQALELLAAQQPDLFIAGIETPPGSMSGFDLLRRAVAPPLSLRVVALAGDRESHRVEDILATGVAAFIDTAATRDDVAFAIRQTYDPSIHLPRRPPPPREGPQSDGLLTARELEILALAAQGLSNSQVAAQLRITRPTVKFHLSNVYKKLNVTNRTQASRKAELLNLLGSFA
jgi:DNA-binding NarL/FixJ family response regulator